MCNFVSTDEHPNLWFETWHSKLGRNMSEQNVPFCFVGTRERHDREMEAARERQQAQWDALAKQYPRPPEKKTTKAKKDDKLKRSSGMLGCGVVYPEYTSLTAALVS